MMVFVGCASLVVASRIQYVSTRGSVAAICRFGNSVYVLLLGLRIFAKDGCKRTKVVVNNSNELYNFCRDVAWQKRKPGGIRWV